MRKFLAITAVLAAAAATAGCVIVVGDDDGEIKLRHGAHSRDGYITLDRSGDYSRIGGDFNLRGRIGGNLSLVAGDVDADGLIVEGDVSIAAGDIDFSGRVDGDASVAGGDIDWRADVGGELGLAAGSIDVAGHMTGPASMVAANINSTARYESSLHAQGNEMRIAGSVSGPVRLVSGDEIRSNRDYDDRDGRIELAGTIADGGQICARSVSIESTARITGTLQVWAESEPEIASGARTGNLVYMPRNSRDCDDFIDDDDD